MIGKLPTVIHYTLPSHWIRYSKEDVAGRLLDAKAAILALRAIPFQRRWVTELQAIQLKMEVAGTSRIENAEFVGDELDVAVQAETAEQLRTRSQKQAHAALRAYRWVARVSDDRPVSVDMIKQVHRLIVTDCDDDHCPPGVLRSRDQNVTFGTPRHRGVLGGEQCEYALACLAREISTSFRDHDPLVQAMAAHYHFAAMHPFLDGNGRTARALEALMLQRAGLKDILFVPMSNFYHNEKSAYLEVLSEVRQSGHDLTPFLRFALKGMESEVHRLTDLIRKAVSKEIFRSLMNELFVRLESSRKRVIVKRQLQLLNHLLDKDEGVEWATLVPEVRAHYESRKHPVDALVRDLTRLADLGAISINPVQDTDGFSSHISVNLDWPSTITEAEFFERLKTLPKSKRYSYLTSR